MMSWSLTGGMSRITYLTHIVHTDRCFHRHFFPTSILDKVGASANSDERTENRDQFMAIMKAIGESFLQPDIALFKQNLAALESLQTKSLLYQKVVVLSLPILPTALLFCIFRPWSGVAFCPSFSACCYTYWQASPTTCCVRKSPLHSTTWQLSILRTSMDISCPNSCGLDWMV